MENPEVTGVVDMFLYTHFVLVCHNSHPFPSFLWNTCHGVRLVKVISAETALIRHVIL